MTGDELVVRLRGCLRPEDFFDAVTMADMRHPPPRGGGHSFDDRYVIVLRALVLAYFKEIDPFTAARAVEQVLDERDDDIALQQAHAEADHADAEADR